MTKIHANPWNPNVQSDVVARATRESLQRFGFVEPVLLRPHPEITGEWEIINGEHRWTEAQALGYTDIPTVIEDLTDDEAKKLTVVLNETTGDADVVLLGQLLSELQNLDDFKLALPYTDAELTHLLSIGAEDWDRFGNADDDPEPPPPDVVEHEIVLSFTDSNRHDQFRTWIGIIEREWGTSGVTDAVYEAVRRAALEANQDAPAAVA